MKRSQRMARRRELLPAVAWYANTEMLIGMATSARDSMARQHRKFKVGGAMVALDPRGDVHFLSAGNYMPRPANEGPRRCAEDFLCTRARKYGCSEIIGMVILAPPQADDFCGLDLGVTVPCGTCRSMFSREISNRGLIRPHTRLLCVNVDDRRIQVEMTVQEMLRRCDEATRERGAIA